MAEFKKRTREMGWDEGHHAEKLGLQRMLFTGQCTITNTAGIVEMYCLLEVCILKYRYIRHVKYTVLGV
jgi:hypothetical protein